jgi:hypothetical protein
MYRTCLLMSVRKRDECGGWCLVKFWRILVEVRVGEAWKHDYELL